MSTSTNLCSASVSYKKRHGHLILTRAALTWSPTGSPPYELNLSNSRMTSLFSSKEGGAKVMIKVGLAAVTPPGTASGEAPPDDAYSFTFTAASSAISDREHFKKELSAVIAANRERVQQEAAAPAANGAAAGGGANAPGVKGKEKERVPIPPPRANAAPVPAANANALRRLVLESNPALKALHHELCIQNKLLSEADFWAGREGLLQAAAADEAQKKGRSGEMVDPKPETGDGGEVTVKITPNLIREIFEEYPSVLKAYHDNVPEPLDDQQFWTRYFQSKLFNRNRTTNRAAVNTIKDDDIFDKYLGEEDDGLEPKHLETHEIYRLLDLAATEDDQHEVPKQEDYTMRAGGQRASLPLMRRFNEHSERLLNQSLGKLVPTSRFDIDPGNAGARNEYYSDIVLDDLLTAAPDDRIMLNMQDRTKAPPGSTSAATGDHPMLHPHEVDQVVREAKEGFEFWEPRLGEMTVDPTSIDAAMDDMTSSVLQKVQRAARDGHNSNGGFSDARLRELTTLQASANEFLRQFWAAVLPPKLNDLAAGVGVEERARKATRMVGYLGKMGENVERVEEETRRRRMANGAGAGAGGGTEVERVEAALQPVKEAVQNAIRYYKDRAPRG